MAHSASSRSLRPLLIAVLLLLRGIPSIAASTKLRAAAPIVPQCSDVHLQAAYLAEETPGQGRGFLLAIQNDRSSPIDIGDPVPLGVDWYAEQAGGKWLWRASSGAGGSLVNALQSRGPLFAARTERPLATRTIAAHSAYSWTVFATDTPALKYRPGCEHCTYAGEEQFHAVLSYAYLPPGKPPTAELLRCGLRSGPVAMPRLAVFNKR